MASIAEGYKYWGLGTVFPDTYRSYDLPSPTWELESHCPIYQLWVKFKRCWLRYWTTTTGTAFLPFNVAVVFHGRPVQVTACKHLCQVLPLLVTYLVRRRKYNNAVILEKNANGLGNQKAELVEEYWMAEGEAGVGLNRRPFEVWWGRLSGYWQIPNCKHPYALLGRLVTDVISGSGIMRYVSPMWSCMVSLCRPRKWGDTSYLDLSMQ